MFRIGHRGAAGYAPENTLSSIKKAVTLKVNFVELDVQATKDRQLVIFHDRRVDRLTIGKGAVADLSLTDLRRLTLPGGHAIPTLEEGLKSAEGKVGVILELKVPGLVEPALETLKRSGFSGPLIVASFFHDELLHLRRLQPKAQTLALLVGQPITPAGFALEAKATHVGIAFDTLGKAYVDALHSAGLQVFAFTVNDPADIQRVAALGVDGIISDFPDRIQK
jgi:glycerophosphoryl diester phosphodiesterase